MTAHWYGSGDTSGSPASASASLVAAKPRWVHLSVCTRCRVSLNPAGSKPATSPATRVG